MDTFFLPFALLLASVFRPPFFFITTRLTKLLVNPSHQPPRGSRISSSYPYSPASSSSTFAVLGVSICFRKIHIAPLSPHTPFSRPFHHSHDKRNNVGLESIKAVIHHCSPSASRFSSQLAHPSCAGAAPKAFIYIRHYGSTGARATWQTREKRHGRSNVSPYNSCRWRQ